MESKFPERVRLERQAMDLINGSGLFPNELVGIGLSCVGLWIESVSADSRYESRAAELFEVLADVSYACHAEADISDEIFDDIKPEEAAAVLKRVTLVLAGFASSS